VFPEQLLVDARLGSRTLPGRRGDELDEIFVALVVPGEEYEMVGVGVLVLRARGDGLLEREPGAT